MSGNSQVRARHIAVPNEIREDPLGGVDRVLPGLGVGEAGGGQALDALGGGGFAGAWAGSCSETVAVASALIHTLRFGNIFRKAVGAKSYLSFTNIRGGPGCAIAIPMMPRPASTDPTSKPS